MKKIVKRILIIGSAHEAALEHIYTKHLRAFGNAVEIYPIQDLFLSYYTKSLLNKITFSQTILRVGSNTMKNIRNYLN